MRIAFMAASSKGLGRALALELGAAGDHVVVTGRDEAAMAEVIGEIAARGGSAEAMRLDVTDPAGIEDAMATVARRHGRLDILVTNAGGPPPGTFEELDDARWQTAFELTLLSVVRLLRTALPLLRQSDAPRVLAFTSSSIFQPIENLTLSNVFRPAIRALVKDLSLGLAQDGILVNAIAPGRIATERIAVLDADRAQRLGIPADEAKAREVARIPVGRYGAPEEFARVAAFLVSPGNSYMTGQAVLVDGGLVRAL